MHHIRFCGKNRIRLQVFGLLFSCISSGFFFLLKNKTKIWFSHRVTLWCCIECFKDYSNCVIPLWIASFHKLSDVTWTLGVLCNFLGKKTHFINAVSHCIFIKFVSFVYQFNIFDYLILSTALDGWSKIVRMLKITRRKVVCNHFEIT